MNQRECGWVCFSFYTKDLNNRNISIVMKLKEIQLALVSMRAVQKKNWYNNLLTYFHHVYESFVHMLFGFMFGGRQTLFKATFFRGEPLT